MPRSPIVVVRDGRRHTFCPQCQTVPVVCTAARGAPPRCSSCKDRNKAGRQARASTARAEGRRLSHYDATGVRYGTPVRTCSYCASEFRASNRAISAFVCGATACVAAHQEVLRLRRSDRAKVNRPRENMARLLRRLRAVGKTLEWFHQNQRCAICCRRQKPGNGRGWHFDHDHSCCPYGAPGCPKCFRGLLCHQCNVGIGLFAEDPRRLRRAIDYLNRLF